MKNRILFVVNVDWFFVSHRLPIAQEALNRGYEVHIATNFTDKKEMLIKQGFIVHPIQFNRRAMGFFSILYESRGMIKILNKVRPEIVHLISIKPVIIGGIASRFVRIPSVVSAVSGLGFIFSSKGFLATFRQENRDG